MSVNDQVNIIVKGFSSGERLVHLEDKGFVIMHRKETFKHQDGMTTSLPKLEQKIKEFVEQHLDAKEQIGAAIESRKGKLEKRVKGFQHYFMSRATIDKINTAIKSLEQMKTAVEGVTAKVQGITASSVHTQKQMAKVIASLPLKVQDSVHVDSQEQTKVNDSQEQMAKVIASMPLLKARRLEIEEPVSKPVPSVHEAEIHPTDEVVPAGVTPPPGGPDGPPPPPPPPMMGPQKSRVHKLLTEEPKSRFNGEKKLSLPKIDPKYDLNKPNEIPAEKRTEYAAAYEKYLKKLKKVVAESETVFKVYQDENANVKEGGVSLKAKEDDIAIIKSDLAKLEKAKSEGTSCTLRSKKSDVTFISDGDYQAFLKEYSKLNSKQKEQLAKQKGFVPVERTVTHEIAVLNRTLAQAVKDAKELQKEIDTHKGNIQTMQAEHAAPFSEWEEMLANRKQIIENGENVIGNLRNGKKEVREIKLASSSLQDLDPMVQNVMRIAAVATYAQEQKVIPQEDELMQNKQPEKFYGGLR